MLANNIVALLESIKLISSLNTTSQSFYTHLSSLLQILASRHSFMRPHIVLFDPETGLLKLRVAQDSPKKNHADYSPGKGITGQVFATGQSVIVPRMSENSSFSSLLFERSQEELDNLAFICVPIFALPSSEELALPREIIGTLGIDSPFLGEDDLYLRCQLLEIVANLISTQAMLLQQKNLQSLPVKSVESDFKCQPFITQSKKIKQLLEQAGIFAQQSFPLLIYGEEGVGKEHFARRIHALSTRKYMPFNICFCDTFEHNETKLKAALAGYTKNAFPTAIQTHKGLFENTHLGTLYLDSIDKLPPIAQEIVLEVLTEHRITRLGSTTPIQIDVRIIASSTKPIEQCIDNGFNQELGLKLLQQNCTIPPLRERREDIMPLAEFFLKQHAAEKEQEVKRISYPALELISSYYYSGNIPELQQSIIYALEQCEDSVIRAIDLPPSMQTASSSNTKTLLPLTEAVNSFEKELIVDALVKANGNMFKAAQDLKASYRIINYKIKKYQLDAKKYTKN